MEAADGSVGTLELSSLPDDEDTAATVGCVRHFAKAFLHELLHLILATG